MVVASVAVFVVAGIVVMAVLVIVAMMMAVFIMRMFMSMLAGAVIMSMVYPPHPQVTHIMALLIKLTAKIIHRLQAQARTL